MLWRIGDGSRVHVFHEKWIPGVFPLKETAQNQEFVDDSKVSSLIDMETREWNRQLIDQLISPWLAQRIKAIPLCQTLQEDCIVWRQSKDGNYSVKTGYQISWGSEFNGLRNLQNRSCSVMDLMCRVRNEGKSVEQFSVLAWFIWCRKNKSHFKEPCLSPEKLFEAAAKALAEFQVKKAESLPKQNPAIQKWHPPQTDTYKINYDGAVFTKSNEAGIGVVVRNEKGEVMASLAEKIGMPVGGVEVIEAMAARKAILLAVELGFHQCIIEGDSEIVFKALTEGVSNHSSFGHIIKDCKSIMASLRSCSFSHVRRQGNGVAHALAKRAKNSYPLLVWMEAVPPDISFLVHIGVIP
ncbi:hypothetical protein SO802_002443 [Lithocarpus litseifolius]|uniref:RNase H type-1 domain-containing protein n=1 Tax=Lithocarpus litseifolius TaxID=425828 RepID=A0AAW2DZ40_9ROSI